MSQSDHPRSPMNFQYPGEQTRGDPTMGMINAELADKGFLVTSTDELITWASCRGKSGVTARSSDRYDRSYCRTSRFAAAAEADPKLLQIRSHSLSSSGRLSTSSRSRIWKNSEQGGMQDSPPPASPGLGESQLYQHSRDRHLRQRAALRHPQDGRG
jgi:hypothetical protein